MTDSFRMYRKPGPPGEYYGYIDIGGVSYKFSARSLPDTRPNAPKRSKYFTGSVQRNLKADQQALPLVTRPRPDPYGDRFEPHPRQIITQPQHTVPIDDDLNDELPENL